MNMKNIFCGLIVGFLMQSALCDTIKSPSKIDEGRFIENFVTSDVIFKGQSFNEEALQLQIYAQFLKNNPRLASLIGDVAKEQYEYAHANYFQQAAMSLSASKESILQLDQAVKSFEEECISSAPWYNFNAPALCDKKAKNIRALYLKNTVAAEARLSGVLPD